MEFSCRAKLNLSIDNLHRYRRSDGDVDMSVAGLLPSQLKSMSKGFQNQNISFSNSFDRSTAIQLEDHHIAQQSRREKLRVPGFEPAPSSLVEDPGGGGGGGGGGVPVYETGGMWSDMFNFQSGGGAASTSTEFIDSQISTAPPIGVVNEWYESRQGVGMGPLGDSKLERNNSGNRDRNSIAQSHQISSLNADSAAAMQLFLMNPQPRSPSPAAHPPPPPQPPLHLLLPNQSNPHHQGFHHTPISPAQFQWVSSSSSGAGTATQLNKIGAAVENQGVLSLTLSSSLQHLEAAKAEEQFRMENDGVFYYDQGHGTSSSLPAFHLKNFPTHPHQQPQNPSMHLQGVAHSHNQNQHLGLRQSIGVVNLLRNSKYVKAAQELLEEFCSVGRGQFKGSRSLGRQNSSLNPNNNNNQSSGGTGSSSSSKDVPPLSAADRIDHQRKKTKLLTMLDEVDRRYNHYCEQMQVVVNSFDTVMGFGSATPYTSLAQKAMSRHFRCLKDAITTQLKQTCELLGDKDGTGGSGVTKGETPRLKMLEQSLRQQRAFNQMGMMEQEAWRPQRGLPERSVNILRAWLFEHFLHPYPSDADKHLLARQTGLSRNQVSNWFINARVRLWKPMVEEMYQQEAKDEEDGDEDDERESNQTNSNTAQATTSTQPETSPTTTTAGKRSLINDTENDSSLNAVNTHVFSENQETQINPSTTTTTNTNIPQGDMSFHADVAHFPGDIIGVDYRTTNADTDMAATLIRYGTTMGDVSLTLGLRHAGNLPEKNQFSVRDFGGC